MESQNVEENLRSTGKLFENYKRINPNKIKQGYPTTRF